MPTTLEPDTERAVDLELIEHLDHDWAVPCEVILACGGKCGAAASWWVICRRCGHAIAECDRCRTNEAWIFDCGRLFNLAWCTTCDGTVPLARWRDLFIVEPLGVRS